jgi:hypothetical protein
MKRDGDIASMFQKHAAKKRASSTPVVEEHNQVEEEDTIIEEIIDPAVEPTPAPAVTDMLPPRHKSDWTKIHFMVGAFESFDFVFSAHLLFVILGYTNELSECLQRREQDIIHAIQLINVAKNRMQHLRSNGWDQFLQKVTLFCNKHGVGVPDMEAIYVCLMEDQEGLSKIKQMMITLEERYTLVLLIK